MHPPEEKSPYLHQDEVSPSLKGKLYEDHAEGKKVNISLTEKESLTRILTIYML